jgi:hypothetical protein
MLRPLPSLTVPLMQVQDAGDGLDQRRFALSVGAEDADALAGQHRLVDLADDHRRRRAGRGIDRWRVAEAGVAMTSIGLGRLAGSLNSK